MWRMYWISAMIGLGLLFSGRGAALQAAPCLRQDRAPASNIQVTVLDDTDAVALPTDFPTLASVNRISAATSPGCLFFAPRPFYSDGMNYMIILDPLGRVIFYNRTVTGRMDFKVQQDHFLTYSQVGTEHNYVLDRTYTLIDTFEVIGYDTDGHDFMLLDNGHALLLGKDWQYMDLSQVVPGGDPNALVGALVIQEQDQNHQVVFEWVSWDYFPITDAADYVDLTDPQVDYVHCNSIDLDLDGDILVSCRNMAECIKISRTTGEVLWRFGGIGSKNNQFTLVGDPLGGFSWEHNFRCVGPNRYTIFDNGVAHVPHESRVVEYELDTGTMTATFIWDSRRTPPIYAAHMGNGQRLANGNTLVGWGDTYADPANPSISEVTPEGEFVFELKYLPLTYQSYRAFKYEWFGQALVPYLVAELQPDGQTVILTYNVFGEEPYLSYNIYQGTEPHPNQLLLNTASRQVAVSGLPAGTNYFRVTALHQVHGETGYSNEETVGIGPDR